MINLSEKVLTKFHRKIINSKDVLRFSEIDILGTIPESNTEYEKQIRNKQCMNVILNKILFVAPNNGNKVILIENCSRLEDNNWISVHIAVSLSAIKKKVLFVIPDVENIEKEIEISRESVMNNIKNTSEKNLDILTNINFIDSLSDKEKANKIKKMMVELKKEYDFIIINTPTTMDDSIALSSIVDSTLLIANSKITKTKDLVKTKNSIQNVGGHIIGAILNKQKVGNNLEKKYKYSDLLKDEYSIKDSMDDSEKLIENKNKPNYDVQNNSNERKNEVIEDNIENKIIKENLEKRDNEKRIESYEEQGNAEDIIDNIDDENIEIEEEIEDAFKHDSEEEIKKEDYFDDNGINVSDEEKTENQVSNENDKDIEDQNKIDENEVEGKDNKGEIVSSTYNQELTESIITEKLETKTQNLKNDIKFELQMEIADKINHLKTGLENLQENILTEIRTTMINTEYDNKTEIEEICNNIKANMQDLIREKEEENKIEMYKIEEKLKIEIEDKYEENKTLIDNLESNIEAEIEEKIDNKFIEKKELLKEENGEIISKINETESIAKKNKEMIENYIEIKNVLEKELNKAKEELKNNKEEINNLKKEIQDSDKIKLDFKEDLKQEILNEIGKNELQKVEKNVFSIHENIDYKDLEKDATYIIPL